METKFNFNSQVCTTKEQSERLLALGLKNETADMYYQKLNDKWTPLVGQPFSYDGLRGTYLIPAWSLGRLVEMYVERYLSCSVNLKDFTYEWLINEIEIHIKEWDFNKDYLEE